MAGESVKSPTQAGAFAEQAPKSPSPLYWKHESKVIPELSRGIPVSIVLEDTKADVKLAVPAYRLFWKILSLLPEAISRFQWTSIFPSMESSIVFPIAAPISILMPATAIPCLVSQ